MKQPSFERIPSNNIWLDRYIRQRNQVLRFVLFPLKNLWPPQSSRRVEALAENKALAEVC